MPAHENRIPSFHKDSLLGQKTMDRCLAMSAFARVAQPKTSWGAEPHTIRRVSRFGFPGAGLESVFSRVGRERPIHGQGLKKYAGSGGWGYADFTNGKPGDQALHEKCFPCHLPAKDRDYVFTRYAPTP